MHAQPVPQNDAETRKDYTVSPKLKGSEALVVGDLVIVAEQGSSEANQAAADRARDIAATL